MNRRSFMKTMLVGVAGFAALLSSGCRAPIVSTVASEKAQGSPWRCKECGHLTRSNEDLTNVRCPRCFHKDFVRITEEEMGIYLKQAAE